MQNKWAVVIIRNHRRLEKFVPSAEAGLEVVERLQAKGDAAHLVSRNRAFPIKGEDPDDGRWWCPYCRRWRNFVIPRGETEFSILDDQGELYTPAYLQMCGRMEVRVCLWCLTSASEYWVKVFNPQAVDHTATRRKRSKRVRQPRR